MRVREDLLPSMHFAIDVPLGSNDVGEKGFSSGARNSRRFKFIAASAYISHCHALGHRFYPWFLGDHCAHYERL